MTMLAIFKKIDTVEASSLFLSRTFHFPSGACFCCFTSAGLDICLCTHSWMWSPWPPGDHGTYWSCISVVTNPSWLFCSKTSCQVDPWVVFVTPDKLVPTLPAVPQKYLVMWAWWVCKERQLFEYESGSKIWCSVWKFVTVNIKVKFRLGPRLLGAREQILSGLFYLWA